MTADDGALRVTVGDNVVGAVCKKCQTNVASFRIAFARETRTVPFTPLQFQCTKTFEEDERQQRYEDLDITRAQE